jgi:hypothetical protein
MNRLNKPECYITLGGKACHGYSSLFGPFVIYEENDVNTPAKPESYTGAGNNLTRKYCTRLESPARDKRTSLFAKLVENEVL